MKSSFFEKKKEYKKSFDTSLLAEHVKNAFADNRLLVRGLTSDLSKVLYFLDELKILFGNKPQTGEPKTIDYTRRRAVSCSLMVSGIPMSMFSKAGLLFDADVSTIRFLSKTDAWTDFDDPREGVLWGRIDAESGKQIGSTHATKKWLPPTVKDLALHMHQLYQDAIKEHKSNNKIILDHNEIKANLFQQGLLGIYLEVFNKIEFARLYESESKHTYISQDFIENLKARNQFFMLNLQNEIEKNYKIKLPIFIWDCAQGKLIQWSPTPEEINDLQKRIKNIEKHNQLVEWITSASLSEFRHFLLSFSEIERHQFIHQNTYDERGSTLLIHLIKIGQSEKASLLIKEFAVDINQPSIWNELPLVMAAVNNSSCIQEIITSTKFENSISDRDNQLDVAAQQAAVKGEVEIVKLLIEMKASPKGEGGVSLLITAEENSQKKNLYENKLVDEENMPTEFELLEKWRSRLEKLFGSKFKLAEGNENLFINPGSIEVCFKEKADSERFKCFFHHPETVEEYGLFVIKLLDISDQAIFFNCLETMQIPGPATIPRRYF